MLDWINVKALWLICSYFADVFVRREALQCFEASSEVVSHHEAVQMCFQLAVRSIIIPFHGSFLDGSVHAFDLSVRPRMFWFCEPVLDAVLVTAQVEHMRDPLRCCSIAITRWMTELAAVIGQDRMDFVRNGIDQVTQE